MKDDNFPFRISPVTLMRSDLIVHATTWQRHRAEFKEMVKKVGPLEDDPRDAAKKLVEYRHEYMALSMYCDLWDTVPRPA